MLANGSRKRATLAYGAAVAGLVLAGCSSPSGHPASGSGSVGSALSTVPQPTSVSTPSQSTRRPSTAPSATSQPTGAGTTPPPGPSPVAATSTAGCMPNDLRIPSVGIDESVAALGLNSQGQIYPPKRTTMWYSGSVRPGSAGISVIAGHVTYEGPDNFYDLVNLRRGDQVMVTCDSGAPVRLRVTRTTSMRKTALQTDQSVWGRSATPVVVLITCDPNSAIVDGHHLNNFIAWTAPA